MHTDDTEPNRALNESTEEGGDYAAGLSRLRHDAVEQDGDAVSTWEQECAARTMADRQLADEIDVILRDLPAFRGESSSRLAEMTARLRNGDRTRITAIRERLYAIREPALLGKVEAAITRAAVAERNASGVPWYDRERCEWRTEGWTP